MYIVCIKYKIFLYLVFLYVVDIRVVIDWDMKTENAHELMTRLIHVNI